MKQGRVMAGKRTRTVRAMQGAAMVEAAIALPIFFLLMFGIIGFSQIIAQRVAIDDAFRASVREVSIQPPDTDCDDAVRQAFERELKRASLPGRVTITSVVTVPTNPRSKDLGGDDVFGIEIQAETQMDCGGFCSLLLQAGPSSSVSVRTFVPLEDPLACA